MQRRNNQQGIAHIALAVLIIVMLGLVGFIGWRVGRGSTKDTTASKTPSNSSSSSKASKEEAAAPQISWQWNGSGWQAASTPPKCEEPVRFSQVPVETSKVSGVLYPGQVRGGNYKPHGGLKLNTSSNAVEVKAIMSGYVSSGARYIEGGETQYMFTVVNNCGIAYRFDHLLELSPAFQKLADTLPAPKKDDSRTTPITNNNYVKKGDVIATAVGFKNTANYSFDLGIYDYREQNQAAKSGSLKKNNLPDLSQSGYALCWLDMFESVDYRTYPAVDQTMGKTSDYCK